MLMDDRYLIFAADLEMRRRLVVLFNKTCDTMKDYLDNDEITKIINKGRAYCDDEHKAMFLEYCHALPIHDILIASETREGIYKLFERGIFYSSADLMTPERLRMYIDDSKEKKLIFG